MIETFYITAEDGVRTKKSGASITAGQPVALDANGELVGATSGSGVYGVCKSDSNAFADYAVGEFGAFGTGKLAVITKGTVRVKDSVYSQIEINTTTTVSAGSTTIKLLAEGVTFAVGELVYADATGYITNVPAGKAFGRVTATSAMTGGWLEIEVDAVGLAD